MLLGALFFFLGIKTYKVGKRVVLAMLNKPAIPVANQSPTPVVIKLVSPTAIPTENKPSLVTKPKRTKRNKKKI
jgi:hypothetical protein